MARKRGRVKNLARPAEMTAFLETAGGGFKIANKLGISHAAVSKWDFVPSRYVKELAEWLSIPEGAIPTRANPHPQQETQDGRNP